ncbi:MAG: Preprotein translocase subunit E [Candidatus Jorgensenbacteria bacterium GW2011_GWA2_45_13]|uniref:Protein translocase subunit SecE n=1 Tax=Candidatus Jorgensenbacteria bacterium GW2011_GWA2_45_13 TaxID=1618662 RepID=A0A0G1L5N9_9BACT|nr:MAG: Preprotein translocase subunit E [Candidatus Jorgensenbacteria bacterium GW2011_GWA2_45_13]
MERIKAFLQESKQELKRVNWPTREETTRYTLFVIFFSLGFAAVLGFLDYAFLKVLQGVVL